MLDKLLNPFGIKITQASKVYLAFGTLTSVACHVAFYATLVHLVLKFW